MYLFVDSSAPVSRHLSTGAVIARCGQPEVSWWGWRNADDEHLVQSIAKACAVDGNNRKHLAHCGGYTNGTALPDTDFGKPQAFTGSCVTRWSPFSAASNRTFSKKI